MAQHVLSKIIKFKISTAREYSKIPGTLSNLGLVDKTLKVIISKIELSFFFLTSQGLVQCQWNIYIFFLHFQKRGHPCDL